MATIIMPSIDCMSKPLWGSDALGKWVKLEDDDAEFSEAFENWKSEACQHNEQMTYLQINSAGKAMYHLWCEDCGNKISTQLRHATLSGGAERYDGQLDDMRKQYTDWRKERLADIVSEAAERTGSSKERYSDYLRSDEWRSMREKVLRRANGICEGCLDDAASEVHHMTYKHIFNEFAFELRALCHHCHERWHVDKAFKGFSGKYPPPTLRTAGIGSISTAWHLPTNSSASLRSIWSI